MPENVKADIHITDDASLAALPIIYEMENIVKFYRLKNRREGYHLAAQGLLPGVFKLGRKYGLDTGVARDFVALALERANDVSPTNEASERAGASRREC